MLYGTACFRERFEQQKTKGEDHGKPSPKGTRSEDVNKAHTIRNLTGSDIKSNPETNLITKGVDHGKPSHQRLLCEAEPWITKGEDRGKPSPKGTRRDDVPKAHTARNLTGSKIQITAETNLIA